VLDVKYPGDRIVKNAVKMSKGADRFAEPLQKDPFYYD
jgi:hypothetical protein